MCIHICITVTQGLEAIVVSTCVYNATGRDYCSPVPCPQAVVCYSKALEFSEDDSCLLNRGIARVLLGETEKSLEDFNRSSKKQGTSALISLYPHLCAYLLVPTPLCFLLVPSSMCLSPCTHTYVLIS